MEFKELQGKTVSELNRMLAEERALLYDLRLKISVNQMKNVRQIRQIRQKIAQILTRLNQAEVQAKSELK